MLSGNGNDASPSFLQRSPAASVVVTLTYSSDTHYGILIVFAEFQEAS